MCHTQRSAAQGGIFYKRSAVVRTAIHTDDKLAKIKSIGIQLLFTGR
jgi:hypothetical protein